MTRPSNHADPTAERTADQSTQSAGGLSAGRPEHAPERPRATDQDGGARAGDDDDPIPRTREEWPTTPRRYDET